ncbi:hypothetical protein [Mucilaginibacter sp.]
MPQIVLTYEKPETLKLLKSLAKYLGFNIAAKGKMKKQPDCINGVSVLPADESASLDDVRKIFTGRNIDAVQLRKEAWRRKK